MDEGPDTRVSDSQVFLFLPFAAFLSSNLITYFLSTHHSV
jgi:hypothetical protein